MSGVPVAAESAGELSRLRRFYYLLRPLIPRRLQLWLRTSLSRRVLEASRDVWPIDIRCVDKPGDWQGWPESKRFAFVLTHDVENRRGVARCSRVMGVEQDLGLRSSFNFVPLRYEAPAELREHIQKAGFEVGVHGLYHDGKLYESWRVFSERAARINGYLAEWRAVGFRSPSMHHNLSWLHALNIEYDASTFDTDPFEPQPEGVGTIFPLWIDSDDGKGGYVELPYTLPQDSTLFVLLQHTDIGVWKEKLEWIVEVGGMALLNTHPDYMYFGTGRRVCDEYPAALYSVFLNHVKARYAKHMWHALPRELAAFWRTRAGAQGESRKSNDARVPR